MGLKFRLIVMNFLQFAVWGAWLISLGAYISGSLGFEGIQIGSFFATMGIASLFMPAIIGIIADRWIPAQKVLGMCHLVAAAFMFFAASQTEYTALYSLVLASVMFYMPTIALTNSVAFNALSKAGLDTVKAFPPIRVFGTLGFICSMLVVTFCKWTQDPNQMYLSAGLGLILGLYSFTLPNCSVSKSVEKKSWVDTLGLRAFTLFKERKMAIFFIFSMLLGMLLQITNGFASSYIADFADNGFSGYFAVDNPLALLSLSQVSEMLCILLVPFALRRLGIKKVMLLAMFAWVLRFAFLGAGDPGSGLWLLILSMLVYGVAFDFFNISGALYVNNETDPSIRSSAQGVFMVMTNGFGAFIGSYAAGYVVGKIGWPDSWYIFAGFALVVTIAFALIFKDKHEPEKIKITANH